MTLSLFCQQLFWCELTFTSAFHLAIITGEFRNLSQKEEGATMKKLVFPFVEIEVPDDWPKGGEPGANFEYFRQRPELVERISRQYRKAYRHWMKTRNNPHAQKKSQPHQAEA